MIYLIKNSIINSYSIADGREGVAISAKNATEKISFSTRISSDDLFFEYIKSFYSICKINVMIEKDLSNGEYHKNHKKVSRLFADNHITSYYSQLNSSLSISFYSSIDNISRGIDILCPMTADIHNEIIVSRANGIDNRYQIIIELESEYYSKEKSASADPENQNRVQALEI